MEDTTQTQTTNGTTTEAAAGSNTGQTQAANTEIDLSQFMSSDKPDTFDKEKITELYKNAEKWKSDRQFFQTKYQQKSGVPEKVEEYGAKFKADSSYDKFLGMDGVKELQNDLYKHAKENGIGVDAANSMLDFMLKTAVKSGDLDNRSEVEIKAELQERENKRIEQIMPMLEASHRTLEENDKILDNFFNGKNMFTANPELKTFMQEISKQTSLGYKLVTLINDAFDTGNVPQVTGTISTKDKAAFEAAIAKENNPEVRQSMMEEFFGKGK